MTIVALEWTILERFIGYVRSLPDGTVALLGAASWAEDGAVRLPLDRTHGDGTLRFSGGVRMVGHGGMLDVTIAELDLRVAGDEFSVSISGDDEDDRFDFAQGAAVGLLAGLPTPSRLSEDGSDLFFARYPQGFELDPIVLRLAPEASPRSR